MSMAKTRGEHYRVKDADRFGGYVCLICDTGGDIAWIRSRPCTPSPSTTCPSVSSPPTSESPIPGCGDVQSKLDLDRKMVLMELEQMARWCGSICREGSICQPFWQVNNRPPWT